jgi:hypothetical protein
MPMVRTAGVLPATNADRRRPMPRAEKPLRPGKVRPMKPLLSPPIAIRGCALALLLIASGCSNMAKPGPQSIAGMAPDGTVSMTEIMAVGAEGGKGTLTFQGRTYAFKLIGGVTGGIGAADTKATGEVYNLKSVSDFAGLYTQSSGGAGLETSGSSDLWLRNKAGVVLHLKGTQSGVSLSLGREEILIEML